MSLTSFKFATDCGTMCVYDLERLKHRLSDGPDWFSTSADELKEVNEGNAVFLNLGSDGIYTVEIVASLSDPVSEVNFDVTSGRVFLGSADEVTSDGLEPEGLRGIFIPLAPGWYKLRARRQNYDVRISIEASQNNSNAFEKLVRI